MQTMKSLLSILLIATFVLPVGAFADEPHHGGPQHGGPQHPNPTNPTPAPTPAPTPTTPNPAIEAARKQGIADGRAAGEINGRTDGITAGHNEGKAQGYREGFGRCEAEERDRARDAGYREGFARGEHRGANEGASTGANDGHNKGQSDGNSDGLSRANNDALNAAHGPGRTQGYNEANASDATQVGKQQGAVDGDNAARTQANAVDYPRGREAYRAERWNAKVGREDSFNQKAPVAQQVALNLKSGVLSSVVNALVATVQSSSRVYPTPEEQAAYNEGYKAGYQQTFGPTRDANYKAAYAEAARTAAQEGCAEARHRDYRGVYQEAQNAGYREGYRRGYDNAYRHAYDDEYARSFRAYSDDAYRNSYDGYYRQHFEEARAQAYKEQYDALYSAAYNAEKDATYQRVYPSYAQAAYERGRKDEADDFTNRQLRLTGAEATETIVNGVFEPGEALRVKFRVRNFGKAVAGSAIKITLSALDANSAVITEGEGTLVKTINADSLTTVGEALEFHMNENAADSVKAFRLSIYVNGRLSDQTDYSVDTKFLADTDFAGMPELKEGIQTTVKLRVTNRSTVATDAGTVVTLNSNPSVLEVLTKSVNVGVIDAGASKDVEFKVITRGHGSSIRVPYVIEVTNGQGRRIGLVDRTRQVPLVNDYRIDLGGGTPEALRAAGVTRVRYTITNVSSREVMKGLELSVTVEGDNKSNFEIIGPNPQYFLPVRQGMSRSFNVPILVRSAGAKGTLQLEVKEDGNTVVIHRVEF